MQKAFIRLAVYAVLCFLCVGCLPVTIAEEPPATTKTLRIAAVLPHNDYTYWTSVADGIRAAGNALPVDVKVLIPQLNYNVSQMTELIYAAGAAQVDALVVQGIDNKEYLAALEDARRAGTLIVLVDTDIPAFAEHLYVGTDNYAAGSLMGQRLIEVTQGRANIAVISGAEGYPNLELRLAGIVDALRPYPTMQILCVEYGQYDTLTIVDKYHTILQQEPLVDTIICIEGTGGNTFGPRLRPADTPIKHFFVFDLGEETERGLTSGLFDGTVVQQPEEMGYRTIEEIYHYSQTGAYTANMIHTKTQFVTPTDLNKEEISVEG